MKTFKNTLIEKINSYKSYDFKTKNEVIRQVNKLKNDLSEAQKEVIKKRLPSVLKKVSEIQKKETKVYKMVLNLETHNFAPELNKLHFKNGSYISVPQMTNISDAVKLAVNTGKF